MYKKSLLKGFITLACAVAAFAGASPAHAQQEGGVTPTLMFDHTQAKPGETITAGVEFAHQPGWHTYWLNPGDSGYPAHFTWQLPAGFSIGKASWPRPQVISTPPLTSYGYTDTMMITFPLTIPSTAKARVYPINVKIGYLMCARICLPGHAELQGQLRVGAENVPDTTKRIPFMINESLAPKAAPAPIEATFYDKALVLKIPATMAKETTYGLRYVPDTEGVINDSAPQVVAGNPDGSISLELTRDPFFEKAPAKLGGVLLTGDDDNSFTFTTQAAVVHGNPPGTPPAAGDTPPAGHDPQLWVALLFAFIGGLILNLMPCVLPVLALKVLHIVEHAHKQHLGRHALAFVAGVLVSFWGLAGILLGLRAGGAQLGWGFQLQSPAFVSALSIVLLVVALDLFGVFEMGESIARTSGNARNLKGLPGAFLTGVLACVVATPCTAPFMGVALAFALAQPAAKVFLVFTALGLGLAAPYWVFATNRRLLKYLPRPGGWMVTLRQLLAFPILATVVWLGWVLSHQSSSGALSVWLCGLLAVSFVLWAYGRIGQHCHTNGARWLWFVLAALACLAIGAGVARVASQAAEVAPSAAMQSASTTPWRPGEAETLAAGGQPVFVLFTADWCLTCKLNEHLVLESARTKALFAAHNVKVLTGDWTREDPAIAKEMAKYHHDGVPFYLFYPAGEQTPRVLPSLLRQGTIDALFKGNE